jgi:tetratricopeptide (TPR) repeat protein
LLDARFRYQKIGVPGAGHPVTGYLAEIDLLQESAVAICRGTFRAAAFADQARARRRLSAQYLLMLSKNTPPWRRGRRLALMREAVRIAPGNPGILSGFAVVLGQAKQFDESLAMHRRALELAPGHPNLLQNYSLSLEASGDLGGALAVMETLELQTGGSPIYRPRLKRIRRLVARRRARAARWRFLLRRLALSRKQPESVPELQAAPPPAERQLLR